MSIQNDKPLQVLRPAIWPDDKIIFYWVLAVEAAALLAGVIWHRPVAVFLSLVAMGILPGMPLFFHTIFHLSVKVEIFDGRFVITSYAGDRLIKLEKEQELLFKDIEYVYYLNREIEFLKAICRHFKGLKNLNTESDFSFNNLSKKYNITLKEYDECMRSLKGSCPDIGPEGASAFLQTRLNLKNYIWT
jgi:hypothetical protein